MPLNDITYCPSTLKAGSQGYSNTALRRLFNKRKVSHILPYNSPVNGTVNNKQFRKNQNSLSISGVQEKFSVVLEKNQLRLTKAGEKGMYILKPIPSAGKRADQMPANEHLSMQLARQVFNIETAENALIFFKDGAPAYITKRFDRKADGSKWAQEDFASIAGRTPQSHGEHYKYKGNYLELFQLMKTYVPAYLVEATKLYRLILFNYLILNGDAHFKNFSLLQTPLGDYTLSPAYDLLNSSVHINDSYFALKDGLLPKALSKGKVKNQFLLLANEAGIPNSQIQKIFTALTTKSEQVEKMINASYLNLATKRHYWQGYQRRFKKLI